MDELEEVVEVVVDEGVKVWILTCIYKGKRMELVVEGRRRIIWTCSRRMELVVEG